MMTTTRDPIELPAGVTHGSLRGFDLGCRCEPCAAKRRDHMRQYMREYRAGLRRRGR